MTKKCIKCMMPHEDNNVVNVNHHLTEVANNWGMCKFCIDDLNRHRYNDKRTYYKNRQKHYRDIQRGYRDNLVEYYVKQLVIGESKTLTPEDIPDKLVEAKRQHVQTKRILKKEK